MLSQVITRGAYEIPDILDKEKIEFGQFPPAKRSADHIRLEMANRSGRDLTHQCPTLLQTLRIILRGQVSNQRRHAVTFTETQKRLSE